VGKRIAIVGAGAIGGYCGACMVRAGEDVIFVDAWAEHVQAMRRDGLHVTCVEPGNSFHLPVVRALHISDVPQLIKEPPTDVAFIAVKSYDTQWATALMLPYMAPGGVFVSLQNSINEEAIAAVAGWGRTMGCVVAGIGGELTAAGQVARNTRIGNREHPGLLVGEVHGRITKRLQDVVAMLDHAEPSAPTTNLWGVRWSKLVVNAGHNGVSAITGMSGNERDNDPKTVWLTTRLGSQAVRVGQALGLTLEGAGHDPETLARAGEGDAKALAVITEELHAASARRNDAQRPSMAQDIMKGRRTETDYINGLVARRGSEMGIDASLHARVNELVKRVERGELAPSIDVVAGL
jgi:2-dehydropantoate 2-reductase